MSKRRHERWLEKFLDPNARIPFDVWVKIVTEEFGAEPVPTSHSDGSKHGFIIEGIPFTVDKPHGREDFVGRWYHRNFLRIATQLGMQHEEQE